MGIYAAATADQHASNIRRSPLLLKASERRKTTGKVLALDFLSLSRVRRLVFPLHYRASSVLEFPVAKCSKKLTLVEQAILEFVLSLSDDIPTTKLFSLSLLNPIGSRCSQS
ncbi:hypothetical protein ElyMa_007071300 [Elysia marginata]|uniref:Uncharacterized protein n=1 Tax=Elysia marginata TaxID=1093978 RepID=A0AAV4JXE4_9GAST|nr:hypothetical protein ElyMa_007071300 [Elysia marginata]